METHTVNRTARIRELNDTFRGTFVGGSVLLTAGIDALSDETKTRILIGVRRFQEFEAGNDPHQEHDFGAFEIEGVSVFWKIDYYDRTRRFGSDDPSDPDRTARVLTIMLAEEY